MKETILLNTVLKGQSEHWLQHEFYRTAVVLGIDIGLEGIGLYLRRGTTEVFARSGVMELPEAEALAGRRQKLGLRRWRNDRKRRMQRAKVLFRQTGPAWRGAEPK